MNILHEDLIQEAINLRRILHRMPEVGLQEYRTCAFIREYLSKIQKIRIEPHLSQLPTAVIARLELNSAFPTYLFRCELDALPFREQSGQLFAAQENNHHACGHDAHMAALLIAIKIIATQAQESNKNLVFCFQPAEEGKGGAHQLFAVYPSILKGVDNCFALHLGNNLSIGEVNISSGNITSNSSRFSLDIRGKSAHLLAPHAAVDAIFVGSTIVAQLYSLRQLAVCPLESASISILKVEGGNAVAQIADRFAILGALRTSSKESDEKLKQKIESVATGIAHLHGATVEIDFKPSYYRSVYNDPTLTKKVRERLSRECSLKLCDFQRSLAGEDFCQFSERLPSCYLTIGSALPDSIDAVTKEVLFLRQRVFSRPTQADTASTSAASLFASEFGLFWRSDLQA